jgi:hypothetical protein
MSRKAVYCLENDLHSSNPFNIRIPSTTRLYSCKSSLTSDILRSPGLQFRNLSTGGAILDIGEEGREPYGCCGVTPETPSKDVRREGGDCCIQVNTGR